MEENNEQLVLLQGFPGCKQFHIFRLELPAVSPLNPQAQYLFVKRGNDHEQYCEDILSHPLLLYIFLRRKEQFLVIFYLASSKSFSLKVFSSFL